MRADWVLFIPNRSGGCFSSNFHFFSSRFDNMICSN